MAVYGYVRVSTLQQASEGQSLEVQERQIAGFCLQHGLELTRTFVERGISGSIPIMERPEGAALWKVLKKGDTVVAAKLDRLFRSALDALQMVQAFRDRGVSLCLGDLGGGEDVASNGISKLFLTIAAAFAEAERDRIRERISQVKADQKERGRYLGGKVPFGFVVGPEGALVPVPKDQEVIATARALRASQKPLRAIQAEIATTYGRRLSLDAISRIVA